MLCDGGGKGPQITNLNEHVSGFFYEMPNAYGVGEVLVDLAVR